MIIVMSTIVVKTVHVPSQSGTEHILTLSVQIVAMDFVHALRTLATATTTLKTIHV